VRKSQACADVTVEGVVARLARDHHYGPGVLIIEAIADDSGTTRRFYVELTHRRDGLAYVAGRFSRAQVVRSRRTGSRACPAGVRL